MSYSRHCREILIFGSLAAIIFLAGCVQQQTYTANDGLTIQKFAPQLNRIGGNSDLIIIMLIENTGESNAEKVNGELIGLDDWKITEVRTKTVPNIQGADPAHQLKGGQDVIAWKLTSPKNPFEQKYDFTGRLYFEYKTSVSVLYKVLSSNYYQTLSDEQKSKENPGISSISVSSGPISVSVKTQETFANGGKIPIEFDITNVGSGEAFTLVSLPDRYKPTRETSDQITNIRVSGVTNCGDDVVNPFGVLTTVRLSNGKQGKIVCYVDTAGIETSKVLPIDMVLDYSYAVEKTSSITVSRSLG
ncbi:MAG: hypothetical protein HYW23_04040 [Candidatus Aenigmarchaeota archaeon]|nr:hypothetical protein [Candidatus Aenigmarchaeota archaeon]